MGMSYDQTLARVDEEAESGNETHVTTRAALRINPGAARERSGSDRTDVADAVAIAELENLAWLIHFAA